MTDANLSSFIWSVADLLRGSYKQSEYGRVILPFTVLRRLDCVLEPTKPAVLAELEKRQKSGVNPEPFLLKQAKQKFYNTSPLDLRKLLGDVQAVQTLSRLNRAYPDKDTTYVLDFVNQPDEVLAAFRPYYKTATLETTTDPNLVFDLRARLDAEGHYDDFEIERVVAVELNPKATQADLTRALEPVANRLLKKFEAALGAYRSAEAREDTDGMERATEEMDALALFKGNLGAFLRLYTFLSQIFDYGTTAIEKRAIFYRRLLPLLDYGRERPGIDLSKVRLTHHSLRHLGQRSLRVDEGALISPVTEAGSGSVQERQKAILTQIIEQLNDLFRGDITDQDRLVYVNDVLIGKLLESETLRQQAANNSKEQFGSSPDLDSELLNAIMSALDAHTTMSTQALNSPEVRRGLKDILLNYAGLYERLRDTMAQP